MKKPPIIVPAFVYIRVIIYLSISGSILYYRPEVTAFLIALFGQEYRMALFLFFLFFQGMLAYAIAIIGQILLGLLLWKLFIKK